VFYKNIKNHAEQFLGNYKSENPATFAAAQEAIGGLLILDGFVGIDNPFGGRRRQGIFGSLAGIILGIVFLFIPTIVNHFSGTLQMTSSTNAAVVSVSQPVVSTTTSANGVKNTSQSCSATAKYTVTGKEYTQVSSFSSTSYCSLSPGQTIAINYNPNKPTAWGYNVKMINTIINLFKYIGILVIILSLFTFIIRLLSVIFGWKLLMKGRALAKTLPGGGSLESTINDIRKEFKQNIFESGSSNINQNI
jgi:hypothetical protein